VLLGESIESGDRIAESTCRADVLPCEGSQACCTNWSAKFGGHGVSLAEKLTAERRDRSVDRLDEDAFTVQL
jgi:hypothetical protein